MQGFMLHTHTQTLIYYTHSIYYTQKTHLCIIRMGTEKENVEVLWVRIHAGQGKRDLAVGVY